MKLTYLTLLVLITLGFVSCRKDKNDIGIKEYDEQQIVAYKNAKGLTNMKRADGDTSGIYYEILSQDPKGKPFLYSDTIAFVYTIESLDGLYNLTDTISNHTFAFAGQLTPPGLQLAINTLVKNRGTRARLLIPSHLAYGSNGRGTGSGRLRGNQSLLYYVNVINNVDANDITKHTMVAYDEASIQSYFKNNNINPNDYTQITDGQYKGLYYKIRKAGTGTTLITENSTVTAIYRGQLLNGKVFDPSNYSETNNASAPTPFDLSIPGSSISGFRKALLLAQKEGTDITVIMPSRLAYTNAGSQATDPSTGAAYYVIPPFSCLIFDISVGAVTNP